jgi:hypothetical protein
MWQLASRYGLAYDGLAHRTEEEAKMYIKVVDAHFYTLSRGEGPLSSAVRYIDHFKALRRQYQLAERIPLTCGD